MKQQTRNEKNGLNLWPIVAIFGLLLAVCTGDGCKNELLLRAAGVACFAIGAYFGGFMDFNDLNEQNKQH